MAYSENSDQFKAFDLNKQEKKVVKDVVSNKDLGKNDTKESLSISSLIELTPNSEEKQQIMNWLSGLQVITEKFAVDEENTNKLSKYISDLNADGYSLSLISGHPMSGMNMVFRAEGKNPKTFSVIPNLDNSGTGSIDIKGNKMSFFTKDNFTNIFNDITLRVNKEKMDKYNADFAILSNQNPQDPQKIAANNSLRSSLGQTIASLEKKKADRGNVWAINSKLPKGYKENTLAGSATPEQKKDEVKK